MLQSLRFTFISKRTFGLALALCALCGCSGSIESWIVNTRVHQGAVALEHGNVSDAELAYRLALRVDPHDERARAGFVQAAGALAQAEYTKGQFEDALVTIDGGLKVDPASVRLAALKTTLEGARLKREIVISNYPTYHDAGLQLQTAYKQLNLANAEILTSLKRFAYTYDADDLTTAIKQSYELQLEVAKNTNRLITYRQIVDSGVPVSSPEATTSNAASLLPLP